MASLRTAHRGEHSTRLLACCIAASVAAHLLLLTLLPALRRGTETPPMPLTVELKTPPPEIVPRVVPPKLLPVETRPVVKERVTPQKPEPVKPVPREERPVEPPRAPILTASPEAPPSPFATVAPVAPIAPEQKPAPPPEPPRPPSAPVAASPAPVTPPRSDAGYLNNPKPVYPLAAKRRGEEGTAYVKLMVTADGRAKDVALDRTSGSPALDESAVTAVRAWRFVPARQGTQAVDAPYVVPVVFKLE